jgi:hypothetical protein
MVSLHQPNNAAAFLWPPLPKVFTVSAINLRFAEPFNKSHDNWSNRIVFSQSSISLNLYFYYAAQYLISEDLNIAQPLTG